MYEVQGADLLKIPNVVVGRTKFSDEVKGVKWSTSNAAVATVTAHGEVVGVGAGSATITGSYERGSTAGFGAGIFNDPPAVAGAGNLTVDQLTAIVITATFVVTVVADTDPRPINGIIVPNYPMPIRPKTSGN